MNILCTLSIISNLLKEQNKKQKDLTDYLGITKNSFTNWKSGQNKSYKKYIPQIAEFFGVSTDYLLCRPTINGINSHNNISGNNNIIGNGYNTGDNLLTEQETALVSIFKSLDVINQAKLLTYAAELQKNTIEKN